MGLFSLYSYFKLKLFFKILSKYSPLTRLEAVQWRRKALDVEERLATRRRERISERIEEIVSTVRSSLQNNRGGPEEDEYSVHGYQEDSLNVYEVMRSNSRAADECLNNVHISDVTPPVSPHISDVTPPVSPQKTESPSPRKISTFSPRKSPRKSPKDETLSYDVKTAPKSFEEVKQLAKALPTPRTPTDARSLPRYLRHKQDSSDHPDTDDEEEETNATSIRTEIMEDDDDVEGFSFRSIINREKEDYQESVYQERSNIYDSLVSVNTVIENTKAEERDGSRDEEDMRTRSRDEEDMRPRRGSFTLSKPSPVLVAYMQRLGKPVKESNTLGQPQHGEDKENTSPNIIKSNQRNFSSIPGKNEMMEKYLSSLSDNRTYIEANKFSLSDPARGASVDEEPESLSLDLRSVVAITPTQTTAATSIIEPSSTTAGSETFRTDDTLTRSVALPEVVPAPRDVSYLKVATTPSSTLATATTTNNVSSLTSGGETFRTEDTMTRSMTLPEVAPALNNDKKPANQVVSKSSKPPPSESLQCTGVQNRFSPESLQAAISHLEQRQQASLGELVRKQEQERQRLREEFRRQQQELMADIYKLFPGLGVDMEDVEVAVERSMSESVISNTENTLRDVSMSSTISQSEAPKNQGVHHAKQTELLSQIESVQEINVPLSDTTSVHDASFDQSRETPVRDHGEELSPLKRTGTFTKRIRPRPAISIPEEAYSEERRLAWVKLTAIGKGFLTRLLLRTEKIQNLKTTIKETVSCAVQLHLESEGPPSRDDLQLHSRLLKQIEKACLDIHDIFFKISVQDRMTIITLNRAALRERMMRSLNSDGAVPRGKRLSSATEKRIREKKSPRKDSFSEKRDKAVREARYLTVKSGQLLAPGTRTRRSPRVKKASVRKVMRTVSAKLRPSQGAMLLSPYAKKSKPAWK